MQVVAKVEVKIETLNGKNMFVKSWVGLRREDSFGCTGFHSNSIPKYRQIVKIMPTPHLAMQDQEAYVPNHYSIGILAKV